MGDGVFRGGIAGWPVGHSLSPVISAWWRKQYGVEGSYEHLPCETEEDFRVLIGRLRQDGFTGINVTIPHKALAASIADELSDRARALGVANTLTFTENGIHAYNTDEEGFHAALMAADPARRDRALILGAGGAAPAVAMAIHRAGYAVIEVSNRTAAKAEALVQRFDFISGTVDWEKVSDNLSAYDLVVNTTSLGMKGQPALVFDFSSVPDHQIIADIIYTPLETPLLAAARERGLATFNGLEMLVRQAVPGFERWTGIKPDVTDDLRSHLVDRLTGKVPPVRIGLTGSIGMGKSTVAAMTARYGAAVWNADDAVHRLYAEKGAAVAPVGKAFPGVVVDGAIDRARLAAHLGENPDDFKRLEAIVHPLVAADREAFAAAAQRSGALACLFDIPLLFENDLDAACDAVIAVTAKESVRRQRVMARPGMSEDKYRLLVARQLPDEEKVRRADYVIRTDVSLAETESALADTYRHILEKYAY